MVSLLKDSFNHLNEENKKLKTKLKNNLKLLENKNGKQKKNK